MFLIVGSDVIVVSHFPERALVITIGYPGIS